MGRKSPVIGVGINDYHEPISFIDKEGNRKNLPAYNHWRNIFIRCYAAGKRELPTYEGCTICEEWKYFSKFKTWFDTQTYEEGYHLDKDLLVYQNKIYSPNTCILLPQTINKFMTKRQNSRGLYPLGVSYKHESEDMINKLHNCYSASTSGGSNRKSKWLGSFDNVKDAHRAWQLAKIERAEVLKKEQTDIRIIAGLQRIINKIQYDYDNNLETIDF